MVWLYTAVCHDDGHRKRSSPRRNSEPNPDPQACCRITAPLLPQINGTIQRGGKILKIKGPEETQSPNTAHGLRWHPGVKKPVVQTQLQSHRGTGSNFFRGHDGYVKNYSPCHLRMHWSVYSWNGMSPEICLTQSSKTAGGKTSKMWLRMETKQWHKRGSWHHSFCLKLSKIKICCFSTQANAIQGIWETERKCSSFTGSPPGPLQLICVYSLHPAL